MKTIHYALLLVAISSAACKKPHYPPHTGKCPEPANCQLTVMHTTQGNGPRSGGLPENSAEITRDAANRPIKYRGYATAWEAPTVNNISYPGNRMVLTDSASGQKQMEVWLNACGQPDSLAWYALGTTYDHPHQVYYHYNADKKLTGFRSIYNAFTPYQTVHNIDIKRDAHGNVLEMTDGMTFVKWTYDYSKPTPPLQFGYQSSVTAYWSSTIILEQFGLIDFRPRHLPKTKQDCMNGYVFTPTMFTNFVISGEKLLSYEVWAKPEESTEWLYGNTITLTWNCRGYSGGPKF